MTGVMLCSSIATSGPFIVSVQEGCSAADAILLGTQRGDPDVVALASHGRSGLKRAALGSVAEEFARRSSRPVLLVHLRRSE